MAGKVWRGGLMGHASNTRNILICLGALDDVPGRMNAPSAGFFVSGIGSFVLRFQPVPDVQFHPYDLFIDLAAIAASCASLVA